MLDKFSDKSDDADKKDVTAEFERLAKLREQGVLDDDEFRAAKASLLNL
ncbi:MAG: SHOCT domain-containing protein [Aridibacter sp.]